MRIKCECKTKQIPTANQMQIVSMIKESLKAINIDYYEKLYKYENHKKNKKIKNFAFAVYLKDFKLDGDIIKINDKVIITITSPDYEFMVNLYNGLMKKKLFNYKEFTLEVSKITMLQEKSIDSDEAVFSTLSPLVVKSKDNSFLQMEDENYERELNYICNAILTNFRGNGLVKPLIFEPISMKKVVVKEEIAGFKKQVNKKYLFVNGYKGTFKLKGDKEDLNILYKLGIGFKRSQGFGVVDKIV